MEFKKGTKEIQKTNINFKVIVTDCPDTKKKKFVSLLCIYLYACKINLFALNTHIKKKQKKTLWLAKIASETIFKEKKKERETLF